MVVKKTSGRTSEPPFLTMSKNNCPPSYLHIPPHTLTPLHTYTHLLSIHIHTLLFYHSRNLTTLAYSRQIHTSMLSVITPASKHSFYSHLLLGRIALSLSRSRNRKSRLTLLRLTLLVLLCRVSACLASLTRQVAIAERDIPATLRSVLFCSVSLRRVSLRFASISIAAAAHTQQQQ